jgi:PIN domain nuclease of toxin-antitoxin system
MNKYLIDTHTFLWHISDNPLLPLAIKTLIENPKNNISISMISLWEIAIKLNINKLTLQVSFKELKAILLRFDIKIVPIHFEHTETYLTLAPHHKDPFDRMLIAQAITENFIIVGSDEVFDKYPVIRMW